MSEEVGSGSLSSSLRAELGALLEAERAETAARLEGLISQLAAIIETSALSVSDDEHDPEGATVGFERAQVTALLGEARYHLGVLDQALARLGDGTYGVCERCGRPIGLDRMTALPAALLCVDCAAGGTGRIGRISPPGSR